MAAKPLTAAEKAWLKKLQTVFDECPTDRLGAYTVGDTFLAIYDLAKSKKEFPRIIVFKIAYFNFVMHKITSNTEG